MSPSDGREGAEGNENAKAANRTFATDGGDEGSVAHSDAENGSQGKTVYGPLSKEESERLQREANEETTKSEDLRLFLQVSIINFHFNSFSHFDLKHFYHL